MIRFILNEKEISTELPQGITLLDFIRYHAQLKGTNIGCREGDCGACTVLVGELVEEKVRYRSVTSCLMPLGNAAGKHIVTIEGINSEGLNPIQQAMADEGGTQCGFCTPGFVMSLAGYCLSGKDATQQNAVASIDGNICRCTGYKSIERAAARITELLAGKNQTEPAEFVASEKILPAYFTSVKGWLDALNSEVVRQQNNQSPDQQISFLSGGTDLYVQKHDSMPYASIELLQDRQLLKGISVDGGRCVMGASTTVTDLCESAIIVKYFHEFQKYARLVSSTPIRNMATLAGNFVNASPIGDFTIFFLALDTTLILSDGQNSREVALRNFYKGYKQLEKRPEEFIEKIFFLLPGKNSKFNFEKVSKRTHLDIASVNTAFQVSYDRSDITHAALSAGGVGPVPLYLSETSKYLAGKKLNVETIDGAVNVAQSEISPISDARGSADYKRLLLSQLIRAHFLELFPGKFVMEDILHLA